MNLPFKYYGFIVTFAAVLGLLTCSAHGQTDDASRSSFAWPEGNQAAVSLSFDDGRPSQVDVGLPFFQQHDVQATFYVVPSNVEKRLEGWKKAAASGQEIANHTVNHPCSGNFGFSRETALEEYSLEQMQAELIQANDQLEELLGVRPDHFAYPCGETDVGRGENTKSYVPLVAKTFISGRGWLDEAPNDPTYVDMAQITGMRMDQKDFDEIRPLLERTQQNGQWLVLVGHDIGQPGSHGTRVEMLRNLIEYVRKPSNNLWLAPVGTVAEYVVEHRSEVHHR